MTYLKPYDRSRGAFQLKTHEMGKLERFAFAFTFEQENFIIYLSVLEMYVTCYFIAANNKF